MMLLATFPSSHAVLRAERQLKGQGLQVELIPVPRQVRSNCGFCLLLEVADQGRGLLETGAESLWLVREPEPGNFRRTYEPYSQNP